MAISSFSHSICCTKSAIDWVLLDLMSVSRFIFELLVDVNEGLLLSNSVQSRSVGAEKGTIFSCLSINQAEFNLVATNYYLHESLSGSLVSTFQRTPSTVLFHTSYPFHESVFRYRKESNVSVADRVLFLFNLVLILSASVLKMKLQADVKYKSTVCK